MKLVYKYICIGLGLEVIGLLGFITTSKMAGPGVLKIMELVLSAILLISFFWFASRELTTRLLMLLATGISLGGTIMFQGLGFLFFPGLVKDVRFLTLEHLYGVLLIAILSLGIHVLVCIVIIAGRKYSLGANG